jgi:acyl-CoA thioester hydrolase
MQEFSKEIQVRWSDLDPNFHLRHSVYYDWGAYCRVAFLGQFGLTSEVMQRLQIGPILFREECVFRKEVKLGDKVTINLQVTKSKRDFARWTIQHQVVKNDDTIAAIITVDGAWMDIVKRKLASPPGQVLETFSQMPVAQDFQWIE